MPPWYWPLFVTLAAIGIPLGKYLADGWDLNSWGAEHWGPVASWFAGVATVAAVVVALRQANIAAKQAKDAAEQAQIDSALADERHQADLEAADDRLSNELDAKRRHDQVMSISPIWNELVPMGDQLRSLITEAQIFEFERDRILASGQAVTSDDLSGVSRAVEGWKNATSNMDLVFSNAMMLVTQPETTELISRFYVEFRLLQKDAMNFAGSAITAMPCDVDETDLNARMSTLRLMRRQIIRSARTDIIQADWLDLSVNGEDPFDT